MNILEVTGFKFSFVLASIDKRDDLFSFEKFNYGGGSFFQKFKAKVSEKHHDLLKSLKNSDVSIQDGSNTQFSFCIVGDDEVEAKRVADVIMTVCKDVHQFDDVISYNWTKRFSAEETCSLVH